MNVLSTKMMHKHGFSVLLEPDGVTLINRSNGEQIILGECGYFVNFRIPTKGMMTLSLCARSNDFKLWHDHMCHIGNNNLMKSKSGTFRDSELIAKLSPSDNNCESCLQGKQSRLPFNT